MSVFERKARKSYTPEVAEENIRAISSFSSNFLSVLSEILFKELKDNGGCLQVISLSGSML